MKNKLLLLLVTVMTISMVACGKEPTSSEVPKESITDSEESTYQIGDTAETELYQIVLKNAELTNNILVCNGEKADKATFTVAEEFFTPSQTPFVDENGNVIDGVHGFSTSKSSDKIYLYYNIEFKYLGKEERTIANLDFSPTVYYEDYTFDSDYFAFYRTKNDTTTSSWNNFDSDSGVVSTVKAIGLEIGYFSGKVEPLSNKVYEVRGVIPLPKAIADDTNAELTLKLAGIDFLIK